MYKVLRNILLSLFIVGMATELMAKSYYVDKDASGSNTGTSWADAWKKFSDINWSLIGPGDVIYISGGSSSKTYSTETMIITSTGNSGTASSPIVITKGSDSGHNGSVILDGGNSLSHGIDLDGKDYVIIQSLKFRNFIGTGAIMIDHAQGVVVKYCDFLIAGHGGVFIQRSNSCIIRNNTMTTLTNTSRQTDGIYSQRNSNNIYEGNSIIIKNQHIDPHCDGMQMYLDRDMTVRNNYIEQRNNKEYNAQGIFATVGSGTFKIYNNVVYGPNTKNSLLALRNFTDGTATLVAYNNTFIGGGWGTLRIDGSPNSIVKNNIIVCYKQNASVFRVDGQISNPNNIDHNLYYTPNSSNPCSYNGSSKSWSQWRSLGFDSHGINADPRIVDASSHEFGLSADSPAINAGAALAATYSKDKRGVSRPQGSGWDIGAFEFEGTSTQLPNPPQNLRAKIVKP